MTQLDFDAARSSVLCLKHANGQLNAMIRMPEVGRECEDVITQIAAAFKVTDRAGYPIIARDMHACPLDDPIRGSIDTQRLERLFLSLS